jgi:putative PIN family toxin of toxin-antitoxin system
MIRAVLDTNVFVQALIGRATSASAKVLDALRTSHYGLVLSPAVFEELVNVLRLDALRARHQLTDEGVDDFARTMLSLAVVYPDVRLISPALPRDVSDTKFLDLAISARADYLVTNHRRHLVRLGIHAGVAILSPAAFLRRLP